MRQSNLKLTLESGETIVGRPNYTTVSHAEIRCTNGEYRWIKRADIVEKTRVR